MICSLSCFMWGLFNTRDGVLAAPFFAFGCLETIIWVVVFL